MTLYLAPPSVAQFADDDGHPYSGAKLFTYAAGSTTKLATYKTSSGTANENPIILNSKGRPDDAIWLTSGLSYKFHLAPATDSDPPIASPLFTLDNVTGVNDVGSATINEWTPSGLTPTYISATSFSFVGDQTSTYIVGRRLKSIVSGGTAYSTILSSVFTTLTTITVRNDLTTLDSGISSVSYGILSSEDISIPPILNTFTCVSSTSDQLLYTLTTSAKTGCKPAKLEDGMMFDFLVTSNNIAGGVTINVDEFGAKQCLNRDASQLRANQFNVAYFARILYVSAYDSFGVVSYDVPENVMYQKNYERQAINFAPVDSNGFTALGGSTGGTTVVTTAISSTAPLIVNAANGIQQDYLGYSITNLTFNLGASPSNGTWYAFVNADVYGVITTSVIYNLAPVYQYSGTPSITSNQMTFDATKMQCFVGNGSTAQQAYKVCVGQFTVAANVVSAITWYYLRRGKGRDYLVFPTALTATASLPIVLSTLDPIQESTNTYEIHLNGVQTATTNDKEMYSTFSIDAGSGYVATNYNSAGSGVKGAAAAGGGTAVNKSMLTQVQASIIGGNGANEAVSNTANQCISGIIHLTNFNTGSSVIPRMRTNVVYDDAAGTSEAIVWSSYATQTVAGDYDAVKFTWESGGNWAAIGTYAVKKVNTTVYGTF